MEIKFYIKRNRSEDHQGDFTVRIDPIRIEFFHKEGAVSLLKVTHHEAIEHIERCEFAYNGNMFFKGIYKGQNIDEQSNMVIYLFHGIHKGFQQDLIAYRDMLALKNPVSQYLASSVSVFDAFSVSNHVIYFDPITNNISSYKNMSVDEAVSTDVTSHMIGETLVEQKCSDDFYSYRVNIDFHYTVCDTGMINITPFLASAYGSKKINTLGKAKALIDRISTIVPKKFGYSLVANRLEEDVQRIVKCTPVYVDSGDMVTLSPKRTFLKGPVWVEWFSKVQRVTKIQFGIGDHQVREKELNFHINLGDMLEEKTGRNIFCDSEALLVVQNIEAFAKLNFLNTFHNSHIKFQAILNEQTAGLRLGNVIVVNGNNTIITAIKISIDSGENTIELSARKIEKPPEFERLQYEKLEAMCIDDEYAHIRKNDPRWFFEDIIVRNDPDDQLKHFYEILGGRGTHEEDAISRRDMNLCLGEIEPTKISIRFKNLNMNQTKKNEVEI